MTSQPSSDIYLIRPKNHNFVTGKVSLPDFIEFPEGILKIHKLVITINIILLLFTPFLVNEWVLNLTGLTDGSHISSYFFSYVRTSSSSTSSLTIASPISLLAMVLDASIFWFSLTNYRRWLAKRVLSKGARIVKGLIHDVKYVIVSEGPNEAIISYELFTPDGNSIEGKFCYHPGGRIRPFPGNTLRFLYLNNRCYFFL
jgi:hypothetical protein